MHTGHMTQVPYLFRLGGPYFTKSSPPYQEGVEFNYRGGAFTLVFSYPDYRRRELDDLEGECEFGAYVEDGLLFFLYRFGRSWTWSDASYNWWFNADEDRTLPEGFMETTRILLQIFVVDSNVNKILQMRLVTVPTPVTQAIVKAIFDQTENYVPGTNCKDPRFLERLNAILNRRTTLQMVAAGVIGKGGD